MVIGSALAGLLAACGDAPATAGTASASEGGDTASTSSGDTTGDASTTAGSAATTGDETGGSGSDSATTTSGATTTSTATSDATTAADTSGSTTADTDGEAPSLCTETPTLVTCPKQTTDLEINALVTREVHWQVPLGDPPAAGWPIAVMFQGSLFTSELTWEGELGGGFGQYYQTLTLKRLLDAGYAVLTPEAHAQGNTFWDTNVPPYSTNWELAPDHDFMLAIFAAIDDGVFGPLDSDAMYATGISSGGYMTSRMAVSYPGRFAGLAIQSASYAPCSGPLCVIPDLDASHPPTLFLAGAEDPIVPLSTVEAYHDALIAATVHTELVVDEAAGHEWISAAPDAVLAWFDEHPPS
ncbi:MAG: dienelactone hydrolase family protein [Myxococcales bacterium]|nr:dienelactone hydrolase family protein [Myxococcales bacterium]